MNGVRFAVTASQPLFYLSRYEKYQGNNQFDRMGRMCEHLLTQQSMCPVKIDHPNALLQEDFRAHLKERPHFIIAHSVLIGMIKVSIRESSGNSISFSKSKARCSSILDSAAKMCCVMWLLM
jgi:hypothetical protein